MLTLPRFSFGIGDRFAHQARAQLRAFEQLARDGVDVTPVWNKSNREHTLIGSEPPSVRAAAERAIRDANWQGPWHVDADHIRLDTVDRYLDCCDFFTIDVADAIGQPAEPIVISGFLDAHPELVGTYKIAGIDEPITASRAEIERIAGKYLVAIRQAGATYRHIAATRGDNAIIEVSMDETDEPQSPRELLVILAALYDQRVPLQTIAPKFTGRFNKGVDYVGDAAQFEREFAADLAVIAHAVGVYDLPESLKLSVHSGSDKFTLYPIIRRQLARTGAGVHVKTAGTTWLEEVIGLAEAGGDGLALVKEIYAQALDHLEELAAPYATVIDIDHAQLPTVAEVAGWSGPDFAAAVRHVRSDPRFNPSLRQLLHVSFKLAAKMGSRYTDLLEANADIVGQCVTDNLYARHLRPLFVD